MKIFNFYKGKLTYTIALLTIVWSFAGLYLKTLDTDRAVELIIAALAIFGIRRAIQNGR